jgi:hypothetical protein
MKVTVPVGKSDGTARELMDTGVYGWEVGAAERPHDRTRALAPSV